MAEEKFECPLSKVESIEAWLKGGEKDGNCPPCLISPLAAHYVGKLEDVGRTDLAGRLTSVYEKTRDALTIAKEMDRIKAEVGGDLRKELEDFDCMAQTFKE